MVGVLGHNGMGKTTLLETLIGQVPLGRGKIRFDGVEIGKMSSFRRARAGVGYVPQARAIFPSLTAYENLRMGFIEDGVYSEDNAIKDVLARFPRPDSIIDRAGGALSGGEQQMMARWRAACADVPSRVCSMNRPRESSLRSWRKFWRF
jgi:ABC-type branched-subunit amino acid transport system ATPase component